MLDAGARRGAKSEPLAVFVRTPEEEIFVGLADMVRPQGREGGEGSENGDDDPDAANAQLYDDTVRKVFDQLGIEWKVIEERIIAVLLVFAVVCATSKKVQATKGARVAAVQGLMNVMYTMQHVIPGGWEESLGVDVGSSIIKGSRMKFLRSLIEDVQTRFKRAEWDGSANLEDWIEASSCSCERLFSYVTATDFGQTTERMCETLWVRCNGEAPEDWGPFEVFDQLRKTPFRPRKWKQGHAVEVEDGGLLGFAAFKDLAVSLEEDGEAEVPLDIRDLWVVPKRAARDADIGDVYGVELEGEDEDSEDEDMEQAGAVASSSSSDLRNPSAVPSTSSNPAAQLVFRYDVDQAVLNAIERGRLHEWRKVEFNAICRKHGLSVGGGKGELMERVRVHFQRLYQQ